VSVEADLEAALAALTDDDFEPWALRIFAHQFEHDEPYRRLCERRGITPAAVASWADVPPVPARAFRHADLVCGTPEVEFRTSGTTSDGAARGRHLIPRLSLYRTAALATFRRFVLPDDARLRCLVLLPSPDLKPDSSLVRMCAWVGETLCTATEWLAGADGLDGARLAARLADLERAGESVLLLGPTGGFARLFETEHAFRLGPASRVMDTGGDKGMPRPLSRAGFLRACWTRLGIAGYFCVGEYGMTELCSQRYESVLADRFAGRSLAPRRLVGPPWLRTRVLDPDTLAEVPHGSAGLLCHHDLANAGSVSVVLTEDLGVAAADGSITLRGRVRGAMPRGCGLLLADLEAP
jgi:hypothetical protein